MSMIVMYLSGFSCQAQGFVRTFGLNVLRIDLFLVQLGLTLFCFDRQYLYLSGSPGVTQNKEAFQAPAPDN